MTDVFELHLRIPRHPNEQERRVLKALLRDYNELNHPDIRLGAPGLKGDIAAVVFTVDAALHGTTPEVRDAFVDFWSIESEGDRYTAYEAVCGGGPYDPEALALVRRERLDEEARLEAALDRVDAALKDANEGEER
jgi:hypothetical protein